MFNRMIVDNQDQLAFDNRTLFLYPILEDNRKHLVANSIIGFVIVDLDTKETFSISNNHPEGLLHANDISFLQNNKVYAHNLSALKYAGYPVENFIDSQMQYYLYTGVGYTVDIPIVNHYTRLYPTCTQINQLVSLSKHEEVALNLANSVWVKQQQPGLDFYQNELLDVFYNIEKNGLGVSLEGFADKFGKTNSLIDEKCYTQYNYYTMTGRPSNRFGGINFAALNKEDNTREFFKSSLSNGFFLEVDFNSYHPRLIAQLIGYDFGKDNVYEHLASYYFDTPQPSKEQIKLAKEETFRQLYGGIQHRYLGIPFFEKTAAMVKYLWSRMQDIGYIESPISGRQLHLHNYQDINANTIFNYFIQMYETESNVLVLKKMHEKLADRETKPVLYTYDSILFDVAPHEIDFLIKEVLPTCIDLEKFPIKIKQGTNYKNLKDFK